MSLIAGTKIGPYEIQSTLGEGGMGIVFRAHDTKLGRDVAVKTLSAAFATDTNHLARFQREAQILAALNHPNIAQIYGLEDSNGTQCIVMELVEGETLANRLKHGPMPADEALNTAKQIAEALETAHEKGIVHRDLKPGNVMLLPDGKVKVLDFGLAKALVNTSDGGKISDTATMILGGTNVRMVVGTAAYMSPEQAKGLAADARSDVFAFGCVLYEMLTGSRAFQGENTPQVLASVLVRDPDLKLLPKNLNPKLVDLLRRCLEKNPKRRWHCMADLRAELDSTSSWSAWVSAEALPRVQPTSAWIGVATLIAAFAVATSALIYLRSTRVSELPETRVEIVTPSTIDLFSYALSPDGRSIVFVASADGTARLWLRSLASTNPQPLTGTEGAAYPFWSPNSRSIGFFADGKLKRLDIGGGLPQVLTAAVARGGSWNADGTILFATSIGGPLFRVPASGSEIVAVTTKQNRQTSHRFPYFLPDGRRFLFLSQGTNDAGGIYLGSLDSPETWKLTASETAATYLPSGWVLWVRAGRLVAQHLDLEQKNLTGDQVTLADQVAFDTASGVGNVAVSASGLVAYRPSDASRRRLTWHEHTGRNLGALDVANQTDQTPSISPDGQRIAVQNGGDIWLLEGDRRNRFTFDGAREINPIWSTDGSRVVFDSNRAGPRDLYQKPSTGVHAEEILVQSDQDKIATDWSADGRFMLYHSIDLQMARDIWVRPLQSDQKPWVFLRTKFDERSAQFSPDGHWVAYVSSESGRNQIYVRPFVAPPSASATGAQWQLSTEGDIFPRWGRDGKEVYYIGPNGEMMEVPISTGGTSLQPGPPTKLFQTRIYGGGVDKAQGRQFDVTRDGRFLVNTVLDDVSPPITLIQNWKPNTK